jgi:hypothetical protein
LLACGRCNGLPVKNSFVAAVSVQLNHASCCSDRDDPMNTEFGRLLDDEIHSLSSGERLQQYEPNGRLPFDVSVFTDFNGDFAARETKDGPVFAAVTIENAEYRAIA